MPPIRLRPADYERALLALMARIANRRAIGRWEWPPPPSAGTAICSRAVRYITSQRYRTRVADVLYGRCAGLCPLAAPAPERSSRSTRRPPRGRPVGTEAAYVHALAERVGHGDLSLEALDSMPDDEVIAVLSSIKGIGRWSAQMILLFRLHRPDVWPIGDLGIVRGVERLHNLRKTPTPKRMEHLGEIVGPPTWPPLSLACADR